MKIFIDTADIDEIKEAYSWGIVDGITTNPSLIKKAIIKEKERSGKNGLEKNIEDYIKEILKIANPDPVSLEVIGTEEQEMYDQAITLYKKFSSYGNVVIKIPINPSDKEEANFSGLKVIKKLTNQGVKVNVTLVMTPEQALLAAKAGATYVSPFAGRIDDYLRKEISERVLGHTKQFNKPDYYPKDGIKGLDDNGIKSGVDLISSIKRIFTNYNYNTKIIAASIRNARQVREIAEVGADIATIPFYVLRDMIKHYKTAEGIRKFSADVVQEYAKLFKSLE